MKTVKGELRSSLLSYILFVSIVICGCGSSGEDKGAHGTISTDGTVQAGIIQPHEGDTFFHGDEIVFQAECDDECETLQWYSDDSGGLGVPLSAGERFSTTALNVGVQSIHLTTIARKILSSVTITILEIPSAIQTVPDTHMTQSFTDLFGEDSDYTIHPPSYTKLDLQGNVLEDAAAQWAMVRDNVTGLIWEKKTTDSGLHDMNQLYTRQTAETLFVAQLNQEHFGGFSDWRLPTIRELSTLISYHGSEKIDRAFFPNTNTQQVCRNISGWCAYLSANKVGMGAFHLNFASEEVAYDSSPNAGPVRAVRSDAFIQSVLVDNGDGTVSDTATGLMWQQDENPSMNWEAAIAFCEDLVLAGYDDWRMPNRHELQSIVVYGAQPAVNSTMFPEMRSGLRDAYFTSTRPYLVIYFSNGTIKHTTDNLYNVRAVRGGRSSAENL